MGEPKDNRPGARPPGRPTASPQPPDAPTSGRVVHDARGNAVWHWVKETSRIAIESTSRLLRKLEVPELKTEDKKDEELRLESDRDAGGGYDPYNQGKGPTRKG
ncbi:MAG TPA: hypothetical protein VLX90_00875 [Steroidobacteraceae bacterium]|nr:hypothetical protein [Steroidobacteraceae bacterium]